ncbi:nitroreductase [Breoghania corrubedonensis]|uniref:Putative NAD(P)H nitroreductase n=1 Tax=Breoghania corrubedonensis TaxID=665038 RepID=A0A2T5VD13_9HYPH|nr:nitroreductase [Breoghania corrubedonensis]PTW61634.1 nitroreductase [Breoghania corrubedonensis]
MPEALSLLTTRRTIPAIALGAPGPDEEQIRTLLSIAVRVPDHGKLKPWRFVLFEGDAREAAGEKLLALKLAEAGDLDEARQNQERTRFTRAPLVIAVVSTAAPHFKIPEWEQQMSAAAACMNLVLGAHAMGFAAQWLTEWYAYDDKAKALFAIEENERVVGFVHIGTPQEEPVDRPRPDVETVMTRWSPEGAEGTDT